MIRMNYSDLYQQVENQDKMMKKELTGPALSIVESSIQPIVQDLLAVFEHCDDSSAQV